MILKDQLKHLVLPIQNVGWQSVGSMVFAGSIGQSPYHKKFAKMLERHRYGILNHCDYPIHTGKLEGINNKIKVIKRKAYGFHDLRYFTLKIYQACYN